MTHREFTVSPEAMAFFQNLKAEGKIEGEWLDKLAVADLSADYPLSTKALADELDTTAQWVRRLAPEMESDGLARRNERTGFWEFKPAAVQWFEERDDNRGRPGKIRFSIYQAGPEYRFALTQEAKSACQEKYGSPVGDVAVDNWGEVPAVWNGLPLREATVHYCDADGKSVRPFVAE